MRTSVASQDTKDNPNNVAKTINGNCDFIYTTCILQIEEDIIKGREVERDIFHGLSMGFVQCTRPRQLLASPFAGDDRSGKEHRGPLLVQQKMRKKG